MTKLLSTCRLVLAAILPLAAQKPRPQFALPQQHLRPGAILTIYGTHLGPEPSCGQAIPPNGPYPMEACGVRVTVQNQAAGLMYVGGLQINVKLPAHLTDGPAAIKVCVRDLCSDPVVKEINSYTTYLSVQGPVYLHMPIWIDVDLPEPYHFSYPCQPDPWDFHGYRVEVRQRGVLLPEGPKPRPAASTLKFDGCFSDLGQRPRFPLHLENVIQSPGTYAIRLVGSQGPGTIAQAAWTDIEVKPCPPAIRDAWLGSLATKIKSARPEELIGDIVPSLLASPDERALRVLLPAYNSWLRGKSVRTDRDLFVTSYLRSSLAAFDNALLNRVVTAAALNEMCPPKGHCSLVQ